MATQSTLPLFEAFDLISSTTILGVFYGVTFTLYCLCARSLFLQLQKLNKRCQARFSLGYISLLFLCATGALALNARIIQLAYINHADFPGGPLRYETLHNSTTTLPMAIGSILDFIINVLTMAIQMWRLWIIWSGTRYAVAVTILPVLLLLSYIALDIPVNIVEAFVPLDQHGVSNRSGVAMTIVAYAVLSGFTILVTGQIAVRLLLARRQHNKIMGMSEAASPYLSIIAMLVESYFLDSVWSLAAAISVALRSPSGLLFTTNSTIKIIAYLLVVYRVETGRGWTKQTEEKLTSLQWDRGTQTATGEASGVWSRVPATTTIVAIGSPPIGHSDSTA